MRWYWIDRFIEFESGSRAKAVKNVTLAEDHLHDHFTSYPMLPNSLVVEGLAQTGGLLVCEHNHFAEKVVLANFGDELGVVNTIQMAGLNVRVLIQACDDDNDGVDDVLDNCPLVANPDQSDLDADGKGDACDPDDDNDGVMDESDAFPFDPTEWSDTDGDGVPNLVDDDIDGDGEPNESDDDIDGDSIANEADDDIPIDTESFASHAADACVACSIPVLHFIQFFMC